MGDLSENADYHKAKEDQGFLEGRIQEIEAILRNSVLIEKSTAAGNRDHRLHVTIQEEDSTPKPITSSVPLKRIRATAESLTNPPSASR
jgi:transcription elongation GreA/GreB family factor